MDTCKESVEKSQKAVELINKGIEEYQNLLFDQPSKTAQQELENSPKNP